MSALRLARIGQLSALPQQESGDPFACDYGSPAECIAKAPLVIEP
jgi:hypothetical protein